MIDDGNILVLKSVICSFVISSRLEVVRRERGSVGQLRPKG